MKKNKHITQATKNKIYLIFLTIWLIASTYIAYEGQFESPYSFHPVGADRVPFQYPLFGVTFAIGLYLLDMLNYVLLFSNNSIVKHPVISYFFASIIPFSLLCIACLGAMHAPPFWGAFIVVIFFTSLFHLLILPPTIYHFRRNHQIEESNEN